MIGRERAVEILRENNLDTKPGSGHHFTDDELAATDLGKAMTAAPDEAGAALLLREVKQLKKLGVHPHNLNPHGLSQEHLVKRTTARNGAVTTVSVRKQRQ